MSKSKNIDLVPWGRVSYWTGSDRLTIERHDTEGLTPVDVPEQGGPHIGVEWEQTRAFSSVIVHFADKAETPATKSVKVQYWHQNWPEPWIGGWTAVDDPFNGKWVTANGEFKIEGDTWTFTFDPLDMPELPHAGDFAVTYRQALKVRLLFKEEPPVLRSIEVLSDSVWKEASLRVEFGLVEGGLTFDGEVTAADGEILEVDAADPKNVGIRVRYADPGATVVTVKCAERAFSFLVSDALDGVRIPDFGVFVGEEGKGGFEAWKASRPADVPETIFHRVGDEPEQSYERASREIPQLIKIKQDKFGRYVPIGCDANRQEFALRFNGEIFADKWELKLVGRDAAKLLWPGTGIWFKFPTGDPPDFRDREDGTEQSALNGYLPIYTSTWKDREFAYEMTAFSALLNEPPWEEEKKRGDEPMIALSRIKIRNTTEEKRAARFWVVIEQPEKLNMDTQGFVYAVGRARDDSVPDSPIQKRWTLEEYPSRRLRAQIRTMGMGEAKAVPCSYAPFEVSSIPNAIAYDIELEPRSSHEIELFIPFISFTGDEGRDPVASLGYDGKLTEMVEFWEAEIGSGAKISVPEPLLNDFNRANVAHIAITADKDIDTKLYMLGAGTWRYQVYGTETVDQCRSLDLRGYHERARKYLMPFVECQGSRRMDGRFKTQEGAFHGLRVSDSYDYQIGDYSLDHGTVLWWLGEHYLLTRDADWLRSIALDLIAACDYVTRERQASMLTDATGAMVWEYGLLPPCHLDDNPEWKYWYIVNALAYRGMTSAARALGDIAHPMAARLAAEAQSYGDDIRRSLHRSIELSPVIRLADGTYIPHTPVRCRLQGRDVGWIREALYGPLFNVDCGLIDLKAPEVTWMQQDCEDNVFVSRSLGRQVDLERYWFSQGGITIQSNLLPNPLVYIARNQIKHALRAFYNSMAANLYADVRCFTEHPVAAYGLGAGPLYKTPDESAFLTWFRYLLLMEQGNDLVIAPGTPRAWMEDGKEIVAEEMPTEFGPVSYRIASDVAKGRIHAMIVPPRRNPPEQMIVCLRHPADAPMRNVMVNGANYPNYHVESGTITLHGPFPDRIEVVVEY